MNTATLYRVQHPKDGRGPFRPGLSEFWTDETGPPSLPAIFEEMELDLITRREPPGYVKGCAVRTLQHINQWFTPKEQRTLHALGFQIVQLSECEILAESPHQLLFRRPVPHTTIATIHPWPHGLKIA